jgi:hypothetical protein
MRLKRVILFAALGSIMLSSCSSEKLTSFIFHYSQATENDYQGTSYYEDSYFTTDSTVYDASLATCSLTFAMASFASNVNNTNYDHRYRNGEEFLTTNGFEDVDVNAYYKSKPSTDSLGVIIGHKKIDGVTLLAVGIRGGGYEMEWAGNFTLGDGKEIKQHKGFYDASTIYLDSLNDYIEKYNITGNVKLWSVGYSRGGASNNLAIGRIDQKISKGESLFNGKVSMKKEDIYCYCFEPPMGASYNEEISPRSEIYSNIHNIVNANDPVPKVAMKELRYTRYGVDYYLPDSVRNTDYSSLIAPVLEYYNNVDNKSSLGDYVISEFSMSTSSEDPYDAISHSNVRVNYTSGLFLDEFLGNLILEGVKDLDNYYENVQTGLRDIIELVYKNGAPKFSFMTLGISFARYLLNSTNVDILINNLVHDPKTFVNDFVLLLNTVLKSLQLDISPTVLFDSVSALIDIIGSVLVNHFDYVFTFLNTSNIKAIAQGHFPELCLSHLMAQDKHYSSNIKEYNSDGSYYYLEIPSITKDTVVTIKDEKGNTVASLKDGILDSSLSLSYGSLKQTFFCYMPVEKTYDITISGAESYNLSYFDQRLENMVSYKKEVKLDGKNVKIQTEKYIERKEDENVK